MAAERARVDADREPGLAVARSRAGRGTSTRTGVTTAASRACAAICARDALRHARAAAGLERRAGGLDGEVAREALRRSGRAIVPTKLADSVLLTTTTDRPIVSATAVAAVRAGFDSSASAASRPPAGNRRRSGTREQPDERHDHERRRSTMPTNIAIVSAIAVAAPDSAAPLLSPNQKLAAEQQARAGTARARPRAARGAGARRDAAARRAPRGSAGRGRRGAPARARPRAVTTMPTIDGGDRRRRR